MIRLSTLLFVAGLVLGSLASADDLAFLAWPAAVCLMGWALTTRLVEPLDDNDPIAEFEERRRALRCATRSHR